MWDPSKYFLEKLELFAIDLAKTVWQVYSSVHGRDYLILARRATA